eukprot:TRINITY_DN958_c0_g2_i1.p1 TRINITY_DN958_c0_g2~~TRINITY_DN958_c0_g2_i1.p1  ORF type:complete len:648 (+),score=138.50 TRINITY_DN958_c0_g2_i1:48-1946(+)
MLRLCLSAVLVAVGCNAGTFTVENDKFMKDGEAFQIMSGSFHYSRIPAAGWDDRLKRLAAMGLNTIQTYVPWNWHEDTEGTFDFEGDRDLSHFLSLCKQNNLSVLLRAGPYMCGEWEFGGLPWWLLKNSTLDIRTYSPFYISAVEKYLTKLHSVVKPHLYENGGSILMVQIENEYGSYGDVTKNPNDLKYMNYLVNITKQNLGNTIQLYTTDGGNAGFMSRGSLKGDVVLSFGDHGPGDFGPSCKAQATMNPAGKNPCMDTEYYTGWLTHWGEHMANTSSKNVANGLDTALKSGYSFNLYMGFGGTNWGWFAGANGGGQQYMPHITSYDYDSPVSENGDHGFGSDNIDKYEAILAVTSKYYKGTIPPEPPAIKRMAYGKVTLSQQASLLSAGSLDVLTKWNGGIRSQPGAVPVEMEYYNQSFGSIMYRCTAAASGNTLSLQGYPKDRAIVFINGKRVGDFYRPTFKGNITLSESVKVGDTIDILIEAMGRLNYGRGMTDRKGIPYAMSINSNPITTTGWKVFNLRLSSSDLNGLSYSPVAGTALSPTVFKGTLNIASTVTSCYIETTSFTKGSIWINGNNIGRYWNTKGPQLSIYIHESMLQTGENSIMILEYDSNSGSDVTFTNTPRWGTH